MKRTGKILFGMAAAGTAISAAAFAVKKYNDRCGKPASDMEPDDRFWEEYFSNQEESGTSGSDGPGSPTADGEEKKSCGKGDIPDCERSRIPQIYPRRD